MTTAQIVGSVGAAALLFWIVGAYNRLVQLRAALVRQFAPVDEQFRQRQALLLQLLGELEAALAGPEPRLDALRAACQQLDAACAHARQRPGAAGAITSLRLADDILSETRARVPAPIEPGAGLAELQSGLGASDATLAFARRQFNDAVTEYNRAVQQFPTVLLVGLFGFRPAGAL